MTEREEIESEVNNPVFVEYFGKLAVELKDALPRMSDRDANVILSHCRFAISLLRVSQLAAEIDRRKNLSIYQRAKEFFKYRKV